MQNFFPIQKFVPYIAVTFFDTCNIFSYHATFLFFAIRFSNLLARSTSQQQLRSRIKVNTLLIYKSSHKQVKRFDPEIS